MSQEQELAKKKAESKIKILKDLSFLLNCKSIPYNQRTTKYILEEGEEQTMADIPLQLDMVYSLKTYDYQGKQLLTYPVGKVTKSDKKESMILNFLLGMKLNQKAWFNVCEEAVFKRKNYTEEDIDLDIIDLQSENDSEVEYEEIKNEQSASRKGTHYEISLDKIEFKNNDTMEGKRVVVEQKKEEARNFFKNKEFVEAIKIYKFLNDITSSCSRKLFSEEQLIEVEGFNDNSKVNFLKCYFKMIENKDNLSHEYNEHAETSIKSLIRKQPNDAVYCFLNAKWQLKERNLHGAFEEAKKSYELKKTQEAMLLVQLIREQYRNKGKVKVRLQQKI